MERLGTGTLLAAAATVAAGVGAGGSLGGWALHLTAATCLALAVAAVLWQGTGTGARWLLALVLVAVGAGSAADAAWRSAAMEERLLPRLVASEGPVRACGTVTRAGERSAEVEARSVEAAAGRWRVREPLRVAGEGAARAPVGRAVCAEGSVVRSGRESGGVPLLVADAVDVVGTGSRLRWAADRVRDRFRRAAQGALPDEQAGLLLGMTEGDTELLSEVTMERFRTTGLAHLVAVSGSNVAVVLAVVLLGVRAVVRRGRVLRVLLALPPLVFFAFLTALEPSVLRAVVTAGLVLAVTATGRRVDGLRAAAVAFVALVLLSPELLGRPGFQLSFAATGGLVLWASPLAERLVSLWPGEAGRAVRASAMGVAATVAAQLAVAPLLAWHFGQLPASGGLANLLVAPLAGVVMVGGMVTLTAASVSGAFAWAPATLRLVLDLILWTAGTFAELPLASVRVGVPLAAGVAALLPAALARSRRIRVAALAVLIVGASTATGGAVVPAGGACPGAEIRAVDVGQGTAVLLRDGPHAALVDGGPQEGEVVEDLRRLGVGRLDLVFVSHPHADHTEGLEDVLAKMPVGAVVGPVILGWGVGAEVIEAAEEAGVEVRAAADGDVFEVGPRIRLEALAPEAGPAPAQEDPDAVNAYSLVLRATVDGVAAILPGDIGAREQATLVDDHVAAVVLLAPHHGSADLDPAFVEAVGPRATVVTVGENRYGHPTPTALRTYARHGPVLRTDRHGSVGVCAEDGAAEVVAERR